MKHVVLPITTDGSGDATVNGTSNIHGSLYAILYSPGTLATGADLTVTSQGVTSNALLAKLNAGTSDTVYYPRELVHDSADGSALTGTSGGDRACPIINGTPRVVVAQGGAAGTGTMILYYEEIP